MSVESQIRAARIPYPFKALLEMEAVADARELGETSISPESLRELEELHSTRLDRWLSLSPARRLIEALSAFGPLGLIFIFIFKEQSMIQFIREGGPGMFVILALGFFLLGKEALSMFRLLVVRDHSRLQMDSASVWLGCLALMFLGVAIALMGFRLSAGAALETHASSEILLAGIRESVTAVILSSLLSTLIVVMHYATRQILFMWRAPID